MRAQTLLCRQLTTVHRSKRVKMPLRSELGARAAAAAAALAALCHQALHPGLRHRRGCWVVHEEHLVRVLRCERRAQAAPLCHGVQLLLGELQRTAGRGEGGAGVRAASL